MRLNEIWDPSMYRSGDESDPRSPDYDGREVDPDSEEYNTQFQWYHYNAQGDEIPVIIAGTVVIATEYFDYIPTRGRRYHEDDDDGPEVADVVVETVTIKQVKFNNATLTGKQAVQQLGEGLFKGYESELTESAVEGITDKNKPKITNWKYNTSFVIE